MKAKHRILAAGMAVAMTLSLAACGGSASTAEPTAMPEQRPCCRSWTSSIIRKLIPHWATMISVRTSTALFGDWPLISHWTIVNRPNGSDGSYWIPPAARSLANCPAANLRGWSRSCANPQTAQRSSHCTTRYTERLQRKPMPTTLLLRTA